VSSRVAGCLDALGNLTYASYMIHFPIQLLVMLLVGILGIGHGFVDSPLFLIAFLLVVFGASHFVYKRVELPLQGEIRSRILGGRLRA
jgi:peptidoglycan/LPS O-acetylase OafA/YrhL